MARSRAGITDEVVVELNVKGPDPEQWSPEALEARVDDYSPDAEEPKGPDPAEWSDEAVAARNRPGKRGTRRATG